MKFCVRFFLHSILLASLFTLTSCDNDDKGADYLPVKITTIGYNKTGTSKTSQLIALYHYDSNNRMIQAVSTRTSYQNSLYIGSSDTLQINYDNFDNPRSHYSSRTETLKDRPTTWYSLYTVVTYDIGKIAFHTEGHSREFEMDSEDRVLIEKGEKPIFFEYDANSNIIQKRQVNYYSYDYSYDNRNGIFKNVKMKQALSVKLGISPHHTINNMVSSQSTYEDYMISSEEYVYKYNNAGYPTSYKRYSYMSGNKILLSETKIDYTIR